MNQPPVPATRAELVAGAAEDTLAELLHRCHRDELLPLAERLGVPTHLGMGDLARACAVAFRELGSRGTRSLYRWRDPPRPYEEVVAALARRRGLGDAEIADTEQAIVKRWFVTSWGGLSPAARDVLWTRMGLSGEAPAIGGEAASAAELRLGPRARYALSTSMEQLRHRLWWPLAFTAMLTPVGCLFRPVLVPFLIWWALVPPWPRVEEAVIEIARLRQILLHRVTIGVVGSPSTGKDAAIKVLFGLDTGNVSPIAGSTKEVAITRLASATALYVVNTPGMGDVVERVTEEARQVIDHIDLYLYLVNAEGGVQARELADYRRCVATGKPVLAVINKIDVLRPRDKERYLADARQKLGAPEVDFVAVAFDPLPQLSDGPINVEAVRSWLVQKLLALGKDPAELPPVTAHSSAPAGPTGLEENTPLK